MTEITVQYKSVYGGQTSATFSVSRWRKHGKDRLYVSDSRGKSVGYVDLAARPPKFRWPDGGTTLAASVAKALVAEALKCANEILDADAEMAGIDA